MLALLLLTSLAATATTPLIQFEQNAGGVRTATIRASCSSPQGIFTLTSPIGDVVDKHIVRFSQPILSDVAEDQCSASCAPGSRLLTMQLADGGRGNVNTGLVCVRLQPVREKPTDRPHVR